MKNAYIEELLEFVVIGLQVQEAEPMAITN
jgi:hypothetical protein